MTAEPTGIVADSTDSDSDNDNGAATIAEEVLVEEVSIDGMCGVY